MDTYSSSDSKKYPNQSIQDELMLLLKLVKKSYENFNNNYKRFNEFRKMTYKTSITDREKSVNNLLGRADIEVNVLTPYISRLCGEFSKQEPDISVSLDEGASVDPKMVKVVEVVEGHLRHIFEEAKKTNTQYHIYRDCLSGGFSTAEIYTEYANEKSFKQILKVRKSRFPTLAGYDPLAIDPHKGDGKYCFQLYPKTKEDFISEYPDIDISSVKFSSSDSFQGFSWSYNNGQDDIILMCRMFKKKNKNVKIVELADGKSYTPDEYEKFKKDFQNSGVLQQEPKITQTRMTKMSTICQYILMETQVLEYKETDFKELPQVFFDGDSVDLYDNTQGTIEQFTRPYIYNAKGAQQLKNLGAQSLAFYLENISQHKFIVKKEAIPQEKDYQDALTNQQKPNTIVVNAYKDNNPNHPIPEPITPVVQAPCPPEISATIQMADQIIQNELGSYDAALGINNNQLAGVAIVEGATQSNAAAMPFVVNYISGWNQIANGLVDLLPKYWKTPMTIPVINKEGKRQAIKINGDSGIDFNFDSNMLQVKVTAGVNFNIQKSRALQQIIAMCQASPGFAKFIESKGLKVILDNFDIRGIDMLKELAEEYQKEQAQMQHQAMQQQQQMQHQMLQNNPKIMDQHTKAFSAQSDAALREKELELQEQELEIKKQSLQAELQSTLVKAHAEEVRAQSEDIRSNAKLRMEHLDLTHRHGKDVVEMAHKVHGNDNKEV